VRCPARGRTHFYQEPSGTTVVLTYRDVAYDNVWRVERGGTCIGSIVEPYSVLDTPPGVFVALPPGVGSVMAGYCARSWRDALEPLLGGAS
jgi:hypothetical protein